MSRSGYVEDFDGDDYPELAMGRWRGIVKSATNGKRGQKLLKGIAEAMDAMPVKELIANEIVKDGAVCALGSVAVMRGIETKDLDPEDYDTVARVFDVAAPLVQEITYMNDEVFWRSTPAERWEKMRKWVQSQIKP